VPARHGLIGQIQDRGAVALAGSDGQRRAPADGHLGHAREIERAPTQQRLFSTQRQVQGQAERARALRALLLGDGLARLHGLCLSRHTAIAAGTCGF
jgi:hypothetical protein